MRSPTGTKQLDFLKENIDALAVIGVVIVVTVLGTVNVISPAATVQGLPAILGVLAIVSLRDRSRSRSGDQQLVHMTKSLDRVEAKIDDISSVRVIGGQDVGEMLSWARKDTGMWVFRGGTGAYTRAVTLPECIANARPGRRFLQVRLEILDPNNPQVCEEYAALYRRLATEPEDDAATWTGDATRRELYATILSACWHKQRYAALRIEIGLTSAISTFRFDVSAKCLIITQKGPRFQAMMVEHDKPHYDYWRFELDLSFDRARQLPANTAASKVPLSDRPEVDEVRRLFAELDLRLPDEYDSEAVEEIITKAIDPQSTPLVRGVGDRMPPLADANSLIGRALIPPPRSPN
jgi:hypothetical protein